MVLRPDTNDVTEKAQGWKEAQTHGNYATEHTTASWTHFSCGHVAGTNFVEKH